MKHRKFVITSSILIALIAALIGGLSFYSSFAVKASIPGLPEAVGFLPADTQAVFGMNVKKFVESPIYAKFEQKHGEKIGSDLADFIAKTGVDPRKDITYVIAGVKALAERKGSGAVIAVGQFDSVKITDYINSKYTPVRVDYKGTTILLQSNKDASKIDKGIAFLSGTEVALGDLDTLKQVIDIRGGALQGVLSNAILAGLIKGLNPSEMFWFAGEAGKILQNAPSKTTLISGLSSITEIVGTLNLTDTVTGKITATAKDDESARKLADVARGFVALGQLAGEQDPTIAEIMKGVSVTQEKNVIRLNVNFDIDLLEKLDHGPRHSASKPAKSEI